MATTLTLDQMKALVRNHVEDFVNKRNATVKHEHDVGLLRSRWTRWKTYWRRL